MPYQSLLDAITPETIVLTPNRRLAATLHKLYQECQINIGKSAWLTPKILPVNTWLQTLWSASPLLLNPTQENLLWEKVVAKVTQHSPLLRTHEAADTAKSAWQLIQQWQVDLNHPSFDSSPDYQAFKQFALEFKSACEKNNWIDQASMMRLLTQPIDEKIILVGFTEVSPQLNELLKRAKTPVEFYQLSNNHAKHYHLALTDAEDELTTIARYAKEYYEKNKNLKQGFVIPGLDKIRDRVAQIFSSVFNDSSAFNISAGKPLTQYPIINTALMLLGLNTHAISADILTHLLHSPFLGEAERERSTRATTDLFLRQRNIRTIKPADLQQHLSTCPQLAKRLIEFYELLEKLPSHQSHRAWMISFMDLLKALGWPGERSMDSHEFQVTDSFLKTMESIYTLDLIDDSVNYKNALQILQKNLAKSVFQPKTPEAPIQVLGLLEALALPFDQLWIAGMDDLSWPEQPKPNAFIPKSLQRELNMPRATALRELTYCQDMTEQFKQSANTVIFSYAKKRDDLELSISPLINNLPEFSLSLTPYQAPAEKIYLSKNTSFITDEIAPSITPDEKISGGTRILQYQALCPFKAFTKWRLHANEIEKPLPGLKANERGKLLHTALELFWKKYRDHETLSQLNSIELDDAIHQCIQDTIHSSNIKNNYSENYIRLESQRLEKLLGDWLVLEKNREPFKVIESEQKTTIQLGPLTFNIRIDRIDELQHGVKFMIDYKSGKNNSIYSWFGDRPDEPQLPLYALTNKSQTMGVAFAQIVPGHLGFKGITEPTIEIKGCKPIEHWTNQLAQWETILTALSMDFHQGKANIDPKEAAQTCQWCTYKPFCRIHEEIAL